MNINDLYEVKKNDVQKLSQVAARAFSDYISWSQIVTDKEKRIKFLEILYSILITYGIKYGKVYSPTENLEGLAIWINEKDSSLPLTKLIKSQAISLHSFKLFNICSISELFRFNNLLNAMTKSHKKFKYVNSSMYLLSIAIEEKHRNIGLASKLLRPFLKNLDDNNKGCYLETGSKRNIEIYKHFDFELLDDLTNQANKSNIYYLYRSPHKKDN